MGIAATLDAFTRSAPLDQVRRIRRGLPIQAWSFVASLVGLGKQELAEVLALEPRTLQRRSTLRREEAERILRVYRVFQEAASMCGGDHDDAQHWMTTPAGVLDGNRPIDLLDTEVGTTEVLT